MGSTRAWTRRFTSSKLFGHWLFLPGCGRALGGVSAALYWASPLISDQGSLQRASIVQGRVTDTSGAPIAGAAIGMTVDNLSYVGVADANRNYSYISGDLSEH
jgi:hypothetical protein